MAKKDQMGFPKTDFTLKADKKKELPPVTPDRSKGTIDLKAARQTIKKWNAPLRKG